MANKISALILSILLFACTNKTEQKELRLFTWSEYFDDALIQSFEKETGARVRADYFSSNEQMLAKLQLSIKSGEQGYDLILPSDYMVRVMVELGSLMPIDKSKVPFLSDFEKDALHPDYDPNLTYSIPMAFGLTGVAINTKLLPKLDLNKPLSWETFLDSPEFTRKLTFLDDAKEVLQIALMIKGKDLTRATEADVKEAFVYLKKKKAQLRAFTAETRPVIESDECAVCMVYSGDALNVAKTKPEIRFALPKEGVTLWTDNFAIPKNAKNIDLAYQFMAKVLAKENAQAFTARTGYHTANVQAKALLPKEISSNPVIYPSEQDKKRFHYLVERKDLSLLIDKEWTLLKSQ